MPATMIGDRQVIENGLLVLGPGDHRAEITLPDSQLILELDFSKVEGAGGVLEHGGTMATGRYVVSFTGGWNVPIGAAARISPRVAPGVVIDIVTHTVGVAPQMTRHVGYTVSL